MKSLYCPLCGTLAEKREDRWFCSQCKRELEVQTVYTLEGTNTAVLIHPKMER